MEGRKCVKINQDKEQIMNILKNKNVRCSYIFKFQIYVVEMTLIR